MSAWYPFGQYKVALTVFGYFRLDGGAMFGSVPKNLWNKRLPGDEENCIRLASRSLLIRHEKRLFLVDVGPGEKWSEKQRKIFRINNTPISELGFTRGEITDVILTHLHFDHAGGISYFEADSRSLALTYPKAAHHLQRANLENTQQPNLRERGSYFPENVTVLERAKLNLLDGSSEIYPGIEVRRYDGHSKGQQIVAVSSGKEELLFVTDLIPTAHHLPVPYNMGYDICAETVLREKEEILSKAVERNAIVVFQHDPEIGAARVGRDDKGHYCVREAVPIAEFGARPGKDWSL